MSEPDPVLKFKHAGWMTSRINPEVQVATRLREIPILKPCRFGGIKDPYKFRRVTLSGFSKYQRI